MKLFATMACIASMAIGCASPVKGEAESFTGLPADEQAKLREMVAPAAPENRTGPYSTPMYYLMRKGYTYHGDWDRNPDNRPHPPMIGKPLSPDFGTWSLDRARPDIQEAMIEDWVELGMNVSHLNIYPLDGQLKLSPDYVDAIQMFVDLCDKHNLKIGVRIDAPGWWSIHPGNPDNQIAAYVQWVRDVAELLKGKTLYYVVGDELTLGVNQLIPAGQEWTVEQYMEYFSQVALAIKDVDPQTRVSMYALSYGHYSDLPLFLEAGYADVADAVSVNSNDMAGTRRLFEEVRKSHPDMMFLSNGVGYLASEKAQPQYPTGTPYAQIPTEEAHGDAIAKMMFMWWELGASTAPYYVTLRNWVIEGKQFPYWYGFFGFTDYVVENDRMTVKRYPGWYAFQAVAKTFYNRNDFQEPSFAVRSSANLETFHVYEHKVLGGSELLIMAWNDAADVVTDITVANKDFRYPVRVSLRDMNEWSDVAFDSRRDSTVMRVTVGSSPVIIRLFKVDE